MKTLEVINQGKQVRSRLGRRFEPGKPVQVEVSNREAIVLTAVKDLKTQVIEEETKEEREQGSKEEGEEDPEGEGNPSSPDASETEKEPIQDQVEAMQALNIEDFKQAITDKGMSVESAIEIEQNGKARTTLLEDLEAQKEQ